MLKYEFTEEQINELGNRLGEVPFKYSSPIIELIRKICVPQTEAQQVEVLPKDDSKE